MEEKKSAKAQQDARDALQSKYMTNLPQLDPEEKARMKMGKRPLRVTIFDIVILLIILGVGFAVYFLGGKEASAQTVPLRYTIELTDLPEGFSEKIQVGDAITDNIKNYAMGNVVAVEAQSYKKLLDDVENSRVVEAEIPGRETVVITLEAQVTETESEYRVNGSYLVRSGLEVAAKGPGYAGTGFILTVERQGN